MGTTKKGPVEMKETRKGRFLKQVEEESTDFRNAEGNHYRQANPHCQMSAFRAIASRGCYELLVK